MPDYKNEPEGIEELMPWSDMIQQRCRIKSKVEVGVFYFNYGGTFCEKIAIILLSAYERNKIYSIGSPQIFGDLSSVLAKKWGF